MQHTIELNYSLFRNNEIVKAIEDIILSDFTLKNLDRDLSVTCEDDVNELLNKLKALYKSDKVQQQYVFNQVTGDHLFIVSDNKLSPNRIYDYGVALKKENTNLTYLRFKNGLIFKVNRRYYPLSGIDKVMCHNAPITSIFSGSKFIKSIYNDRRHKDTKDIWGMDPVAIRGSISNLVEVLNTDFRIFWYKTNFTAQEAVYIVEHIAECTHALLCMIEVNHAHTTCRPKQTSNEVAMEMLDVTIGKFHGGQTAIEFAEVAMCLTGRLLESLVKDNYQNVFRGYVNS